MARRRTGRRRRPEPGRHHDRGVHRGRRHGTSITEDNDGDELEATITLSFPYGVTSDNLSQDDSLDLSDYTVALTQVHS